MLHLRLFKAFCWIILFLFRRLTKYMLFLQFYDKLKLFVFNLLLINSNSLHGSGLLVYVRRSLTRIHTTKVPWINVTKFLYYRTGICANNQQVVYLFILCWKMVFVSLCYVFQSHVVRKL